ncbi:hypothetical protein CYMTET_29936 [Cymbomonas tetramitiformis]|uniref:Mitochondrial carrier protein n=1 Tax=Cymbomonas tetramitiformis TaxID=36881 RepID=A0AAE0FK13_9CHLO|nr:hypothetical protein CYMTET_29936 [Cymbomonas tetramitiformis]
MSFHGTLHEEIGAGMFSGAFSTLCGFPLDTIKTRLQSQQSGVATSVQYKGALDCVYKVGRTDGPLSLFKGVTPKLGESLIMNSFMFVAYEYCKQQIGRNESGGGGPYQFVSAGAFSGLVTSFVSTPFDLVKIQLQLDNVRSRTLPTSAALLRQLSKRGGPFLLSRLYTGHTLNMGREVFFTSIYLGLYDSLKSGMVEDKARGASIPLTVAASASTGALAWLVCYPFDLVKTVIQGQELLNPRSKRPLVNTVEAIRTIWHVDGARGFYKGALTSTFRAMLVTSSRMVAYEWYKNNLSMFS